MADRAEPPTARPRSRHPLVIAARRRTIVVIAMTLVAVAVALGLHWGRQTAQRDRAEERLASAESTISDISGVSGVITTVEQSYRPPLRRTRLFRPDWTADGSARVEVLVGPEITAAALAETIDRARGAAIHAELEDYDIDIVVRSSESGLRVLDRWRFTDSGPGHSAEELPAIAALALELPERARLDLNPGQGAEDDLRTGPPLFSPLLGMDAGQGIGIAAELDGTTAATVLAQAAAVSHEAAVALPATTALVLRSAQGSEVTVMTRPPQLPEVLDRVAERIDQVPAADDLVVTMSTEVTHLIGIGTAEDVLGVVIDIDPGPDGCADSDLAQEREALVRDLRGLASPEVDVQVRTGGCAG